MCTGSGDVQSGRTKESHKREQARKRNGICLRSRRLEMRPEMSEETRQGFLGEDEVQ